MLIYQFRKISAHAARTYMHSSVRACFSKCELWAGVIALWLLLRSAIIWKGAQ